MSRQCPLRVIPLSRLLFKDHNIHSTIRQPLDDTSMYKGRLLFEIPKDATHGKNIRGYYLMIYYAKWILINAPVIVLSWILALWMCDWSITCAAWGFVGIIAASLWYYWIHRLMHDPSLLPNNDTLKNIMQSIAWFHRANHHGESDVLSANLRKWRIMRVIVMVCEWIYEIIIIGGAIIALIPVLPRPTRVFALMFAVFCVVMHHTNCHGTRVYSLFHGAHHKDARSNYMPEIWDNVFGSLAEGSHVLRVVDDNYVWWITLTLALVVKFAARKYNFKICSSSSS